MINPNELLFSVDENNEPIDPQPRALSHKQRIWHRGCHVYIVDSKRQLVLAQKRSIKKDNNPGLWEAPTGGHLLAGQTYEQGAVAEIGEEIGLSISENDLQFVKVAKNERHPEYIGVFKYEWAGDINWLTLEKEEVDEVKWFPVDYIIRHTHTNPDDQWVHFPYSMEFLQSE
jgi:8-oxo-dGTP pyrophosphatase MutT (NUDIX family)